LKYCQENKGLEIFGWCLMSSHIHLIIRAKEGYNLSDILRDFKKFTPNVGRSLRLRPISLANLQICEGKYFVFAPLLSLARNKTALARILRVSYMYSASCRGFCI
jgi:REP element-mobilizing transposase RayT